MRLIALAIISLALLIALAGADGNFKPITGVNFEGLGGTTQVHESNFKPITGINFGGLEGSTETGGSNFKPITGVNFEGLDGNSQGGTSTSGTSEIVNVSESSIIVYVGGSSIPLGTYQTTFGNYLWIERDRGWSQYISIPQYSSISLIAYTPTGGEGEIFEMYPGSALQGVYKGLYNNFNPGYNRLMYRGDVAGRHHLLFTINDQPSNGIVIDVMDGTVSSSSPVLGTSP